MSVINLPKQYIHSGIIMGPGTVDVSKRMKEAGHSDESAKQAHDDLIKKVAEFTEKEKRGENPSLAPISYEEMPKVDGSATAVQPANRGTDPDTTQKSPDAVRVPTSVQQPPK